MTVSWEQLAGLLSREYGLQVFSIHHLAPVYRVKTPAGPLCLKFTDKKENHLAFMCLAMARLNKQGFTKSPTVLATRNGKLYTRFQNHWCFLTNWAGDTPCDFRRPSHLDAATATLAEFHQYAQGLEVPVSVRRRPYWLRWPQVIARRIRDLEAYKQQVVTGFIPGLPGDFLHLLAEQINAAKKSLAILEKSRYNHLALQACNTKTFIHRDVAARNFVLNYAGQAGLIDFDYCRWDLPLIDLTRLLDRTLRRHRWSLGLAQHILSVYDAVNPLNPAEYPVLLAFLQFPQKFWRLCQRYFANPQPLAPGVFIRSIRDLTRDLPARTRLLHNLATEYCWGFVNQFNFPTLPVSPATTSVPARLGIPYQLSLYHQTYQEILTKDCFSSSPKLKD
ncbi:MAG: CotS family spore coat protein [Heliobacteriaceae bacterium]|nr:CotS family spore coat protein [Heliobacteriaceae bacterium]